ncbi:MAG: energy-coupling factor ABC transporter ATP-binding protein [Kiritimatiellae bacterium]|nr:energy-coupling factor ABC transporter ATP-binding protein [Kiritimatiellia bacterium]
MSHHIIEARNLRYAYPDGTEALKGISFRITHGEAVAVIGANGSGKSTLLLHLGGALLPADGEMRIGETPFTRRTASVVRRAVGLVFQDPDDQLFMPTVLEDVAFGPLNAGLPAEEVERRASLALERVGMLHLKDRPPYRLSAGEKRAVTIATVLAMAPDILVLDEPSSNLDSRGRRRLIGLLQSFEHTRIIATHDLEMALEVCSRAIMLNEGRVTADGAVRDILNDTELMDACGLECPISLRKKNGASL